jgi:hypothetical protein
MKKKIIIFGDGDEEEQEVFLYFVGSGTKYF